MSTGRAARSKVLEQAACASVLTASPPVSWSRPPQCKRSSGYLVRVRARVRVSSGCLCGTQGGTGFGQLALLQRQSMPQATPSCGQPRPISRSGRAGRPHWAWPCSAQGRVPRPIGVSAMVERDSMSKMERCGDSISSAMLKSQSYLHGEYSGVSGVSGVSSRSRSRTYMVSVVVLVVLAVLVVLVVLAVLAVLAVLVVLVV